MVSYFCINFLVEKSLYDLLTPIIPPSAPANMLEIIIIIECVFSEKSFSIMLDNK